VVAAVEVEEALLPEAATDVHPKEEDPSPVRDLVVGENIETTAEIVVALDPETISTDHQDQEAVLTQEGDVSLYQNRIILMLSR